MDNNLENEVKLGFIGSVFEWIEDFIIAVVFVSILFTFVISTKSVLGISMEPNYIDGDRVITISRHLGIEQGDSVIIVNVLEDPIIKRVIATAGQTIDIDDESGSVIVDGEILDNSQFGVENGITFSGSLELPATVPNGCVFVLGDNREASKDSRFSDVGMVDIRNVYGKVIFRIMPFDRFGTVK